MTITWNTVKKFFTGNDIAIMRARDVHLDDYRYVAEHFKFILSYIVGKRMPPDLFPQWDKKKIDQFEAWGRANFPKKAAVTGDLQGFIALSEFLTGVDTLGDDPELAQKYLDRLRTTKKNPDKSNELLVNQQDLQALIDTCQTETWDQQLEEDLKEDNNKKAAQTIILLWYTGAFINEGGFPYADNGTPEDNQYVEGLAWRVGQAHPMAYSTDGTVIENGEYLSNHYWSKKPEGGQNTGLGNPQV
jgi:hypothetical protein